MTSYYGVPLKKHKPKKEGKPVFNFKKEKHTDNEIEFYNIYGMYPVTDVMLEQFLKGKAIEKGFSKRLKYE